MDPEATLPPLRRSADPRIEQLVLDVAEAKAAQGRMQTSIDDTKTLLDANTRLTAEMKGTVDDVRDILTSMKVLKTAAVWLSSIIAAIGATWAAIRQIKG